MDTSIHGIQPDPHQQPGIRRAGKPQRDGDQQSRSFSEALGEDEPETSGKKAPADEPPAKSPTEEGVGDQIDVVG